MYLKENTTRLALSKAYEKTKKVIDSCVLDIHVEAARNYVENFRRFLSCINCESKEGTELLKQMIDEIELKLRLKYISM